MSRLAAQKEWAFMKARRPASPFTVSQSKILSADLVRTRVSCASSNRSGPALYLDGIHRCLSAVRKRVLPPPVLSFFSHPCAFYRRQVSDIPNPGKLYSDLMDIIVRFAQAGLIHGDYNEFNILIRQETGEPVIIDFPQMVSTSHENAEWCVCCSCVCN